MRRPEIEILSKITVCQLFLCKFVNKSSKCNELIKRF